MMGIKKNIYFTVTAFLKSQSQSTTTTTTAQQKELQTQINNQYIDTVVKKLIYLIFLTNKSHLKVATITVKRCFVNRVVIFGFYFIPKLTTF